MQFTFLQKQTSRREMLRDSVTLAGGGFLLAHLFPTTLLRASAAGAQQSPSAADLLASMRAKFNAVPLQTQKLADNVTKFPRRSEEHTSELQSQFHLVCRLLLEKKKKQINYLGIANKKLDIEKKKE